MVASQSNALRGSYDKAFTVPPRSLRDYLAIFNLMVGVVGLAPTRTMAPVYKTSWITITEHAVFKENWFGDFSPNQHSQYTAN